MTTQVEETTRTRLVGAPIKRVEDPRLITGAGKYLDDLAPLSRDWVAVRRALGYPAGPAWWLPPRRRKKSHGTGVVHSSAHTASIRR